jgi:hypothetical protein
MSQHFWNLFSPTSKATFGGFSPPTSRNTTSPDSTTTPEPVQPLAGATPASLLSGSGSESLSDIVQRRYDTKPIQMGHVDELSKAIKGFFLSDSAYLEKHRHYEACARRPTQRFDIRQIGLASQTTHKEGSHEHYEHVQIFCCRYGEEFRPASSSKAALTLAIPSLAGLKAPEAISLVNPLSMLPREYVQEGEAGAIVCFSPSSQQYVADLYWSPSAFLHSLNQVQHIGKMLIETAAIEEAASNGFGVVDVHRASAILAKLYEGVAQVGQAVDEPFFSAGLWGVAVLPQRNNTYRCMVGVVALNIPELESDAAQKPGELQRLFASERHFAIATFRLYRDGFGFLKISSEDCTLYPLKPVRWFDDLPAVA